jgi:hypothetical protein
MMSCCCCWEVLLPVARNTVSTHKTQQRAGMQQEWSWQGARVEAQGEPGL